MKNKISLTLLLVSCSISAQLQEINDSLEAIKVIDSLQAIIHLQKGDTTEVNALFSLSRCALPVDSRAEYARQGLALAQKIKYEKGEADCLFSLAHEVASAGNQSEAVNYCFNALRIYTDIDDFQGITSVQMLLYIILP
jgi:hypothetical protein